jgi:hypothetical protein
MKKHVLSKPQAMQLFVKNQNNYEALLEMAENIEDWSDAFEDWSFSKKTLKMDSFSIDIDGKIIDLVSAMKIISEAVYDKAQSLAIENQGLYRQKLVP